MASDFTFVDVNATHNSDNEEEEEEDIGEPGVVVCSEVPPKPKNSANVKHCETDNQLDVGKYSDKVEAHLSSQSHSFYCASSTSDSNNVSPVDLASESSKIKVVPSTVTRSQCCFCLEFVLERYRESKMHHVIKCSAIQDMEPKRMCQNKNCSQFLPESKCIIHEQFICKLRKRNHKTPQCPNCRRQYRSRYGLSYHIVQCLPFLRQCLEKLQQQTVVLADRKRPKDVILLPIAPAPAYKNSEVFLDAKARPKTLPEARQALGFALQKNVMIQQQRQPKFLLYQT